MDKNGSPAFPARGERYDHGGMTLRQYAAIKLRVPDSGTDWLDEMIRVSLRDEFAKTAMQGIVGIGLVETWEGDALNAYHAADAMLKQREVKS